MKLSPTLLQINWSALLKLVYCSKNLLIGLNIIIAITKLFLYRTITYTNYKSLKKKKRVNYIKTPATIYEYQFTLFIYEPVHFDPFNYRNISLLPPLDHFQKWCICTIYIVEWVNMNGFIDEEVKVIFVNSWGALDLINPKIKYDKHPLFVFVFCF